MVGDFPEPGGPALGGVAAAVAAIVAPLSRRVALRLVVPGCRQSLEARVDGVPVTYLASGRLPGVLRYWTADARQIAQAVAQEAADIVHIQGAAGWGLWSRGKSIVTVHGIPHLNVVSRRGGGLLGRVLRPLAAAQTALVERVARRKAGNIVVINPYVADALPDVRTLATAIIPNPVHQDFVSQPVTSLPEPGRVVYVGRVEESKGVLDAIDLAAAVGPRVPGFSLRFVGGCADPGFLRHCRERVTARGLGGRIEFVGPMARDEIIAEYDRASCLLTLSHQETAPVVVGEALCRGLPVAGVDRFGLPFMVQAGSNGRLLPVAGAEAQAQVLCDVLLAPWRREVIRAEALQTYAPDVVASRLAELYERVATASPEPSLVAR
jgi:glycosyltransferase involved in cell wall biosynthesis